MKERKRIELVIDALHVERVTELLKKAGVEGYTVLRGASGWGTRGARVPDGVSGAFENCIVLCVCPPERLDGLIGPLGETVKRYGGVAMVSDVQLI